MAGIGQFKDFIGKFFNLWQEGLDATLELKTSDGEAHVILRAGPLLSFIIIHHLSIFHMDLPSYGIANEEQMPVKQQLNKLSKTKLIKTAQPTEDVGLIDCVAEEAEIEQSELADNFVIVEVATNEDTTKDDDTIVADNISGNGSAAVKIALKVNDEIFDDQNYDNKQDSCDVDCEFFCKVQGFLKEISSTRCS